MTTKNKEIQGLAKEFLGTADEQVKSEMLALMTDYEARMMNGSLGEVATLLYTYKRMAEVFKEKMEAMRDCAIALGFPMDESIPTLSGKQTVRIISTETKVDGEALSLLVQADEEVANKVNLAIEKKRATINLGTLTLSDYKKFDSDFAKGLPTMEVPRPTLKAYPVNKEATKV